MVAAGRTRSSSHAVRIPVVLHGVCLGLGGPDEPDADLTVRIARLADDIASSGGVTAILERDADIPDLSTLLATWQRPACTP